MESSSHPDTYHLVGVAVAASQVFEATFVLAAKLALKQAGAATLRDVAPVSQSTSFKQPVKSLLGELLAKGLIDETLKERVSEVVEGRHRIIHRAFLELGWPAATDNEGQLCDLCVRVSAESQDLSTHFLELLVEWMKQFPETAESAKNHQRANADVVERIRAQTAALRYT